MDNQKWQKVETIFHGALELEGAARAHYLERACQGQPSLMREVKSLLLAIDETPDFMDETAFNLGLQAMEISEQRQQPPSLEGTTVGAYRVGRKLGAGGMGDVYLAEDTRLHREVALKFLSAATMNDVSAARRLLREARAVAKLDHPHICPVYGIENIDGHQFIVMQYVEGETLSQLIKEQRLAPERVLPIARQIAEALAAAHAEGIVHRDVKPGNIMVGPDGQIKVLDFGLAKIIEPEGKPSDETILSQKGLILGTIAYMSPEQLKGDEIDFSSDVFSFGILLYELFHGKNPFAHESDAETISAILRGESAEFAKPHRDFPLAAQKLIKRCLELDRTKRYRDAGELLAELRPLKRREGFDYFNFLRRAALAAALVLLTLAGVYIYQKATEVRTLAVLPFSNEATDAEYLSNGIAEDFINRLSGSNRVRVKNFSSVSGYRSEAVDPIRTGRELNADAVLMGKIRRQNDQLVLSTALIDTNDGSTLWNAENVVRDSELLRLQNEITEIIVKRLEPWSSLLLPGRTSAARRPEDPEAFNLYIKGRYFWQKRDKANLARAIDLFQQAINIDPSYAKAHAGLADCYIQQSQVAYGDVSGREAMAKAKAAARKAVETDPLSPEAHTSLANVLFKFDWNWTEAEREFRQAISLDPDNATAHYFYSNMLSVTGRPEEAMFYGLKARELDPFSQVTKINIARIHYNAGRYDDALAVMNARDENTIESNQKTRYMLGLIYIKKGMYAEAVPLYEEIYNADKSFGAAPLGFCYARTGRTQQALEVLNERERSGEYFPPTEKAVIYGGLGDKPRALAALREAVEGKYSAIISLKVEPLHEELRDEPEFAALLREMNF